VLVAEVVHIESFTLTVGVEDAIFDHGGGLLSALKKREELIRVEMFRKYIGAAQITASRLDAWVASGSQW
jgi:hypothetical protein